jgi:hypothetical protein
VRSTNRNMMAEILFAAAPPPPPSAVAHWQSDSAPASEAGLCWHHLSHPSASHTVHPLSSWVFFFPYEPLSGNSITQCPSTETPQFIDVPPTTHMHEIDRHGLIPIQASPAFPYIYCSSCVEGDGVSASLVILVINPTVASGRLTRKGYGHHDH